MPSLFGKALCGPDFSLRLEDYGYSIRPASFDVPYENIPLNPKNETFMTQNFTNSNFTKKRRLINDEEFKATYCRNLYNEMRNVGGYVIGNLITPLLFGKILYTPRTNLTYQIIQKVL